MQESLKNLSVGSTATAEASLAPADISKKKLLWKISNPRVAAVDQNGTIRVLAGGSAVITVTEQTAAENRAVPRTTIGRSCSAQSKTAY